MLKKEIVSNFSKKVNHTFNFKFTKGGVNALAISCQGSKNKIFFSYVHTDGRYNDERRCNE
jgi:hypothetical protein